MGTGVSNLKFWEEQPSLFGNDEDGANNSIYLSYNVFLGLSLLGGFLALDHLYLRSPVTFLAKIIVNLLCFGVWYWYDALQAIWNSDVIKLYGLSVPVLGPKGIGAGVLAKEKPSKLHLNFLIYSMCLIFGGIFGLDSFLVGDNRSGVIRLISLITIIGTPIAICWWCYNLFMYFTDTEYVINMNGPYFGRPGGSFASRLLGFIPSFLVPIIKVFVEPVTEAIALGNETLVTVNKGIDTLPEVAREITGTFSGLVNASRQVGNISPLSALATDSALRAESAVQRAQQAQSQMKGPQTGSSPSAPPLSQQTGQQTGQQGGGSMIDSDLNALPYTLLGTVAFISIAGFAVTYYRSKKNVKPEADDSPPEPGVLRKPHQEESTGTA
jgi:hypothetical protein